MLLKGSDIDLRDIPSAIGGDETSRRGIVLASSIPAKKFGIKTGESLYNARKKCPELRVERADFFTYEQESRKMVELLYEYSPNIKRFSIDECFMDFDTQYSRFKSGEECAKEISKFEHVPSKQHPDTLFSFMGKLAYLCDIIEHKMIPPRYCVEDISYLNIDGLEKIAFPMRCFCDISLHKLSEHLGCYGQYGIAFTKVFGKDHGIQPLQYINEKSELRKDFTETFNTVFKSTCKDDDFKTAKNMLLHQLMFLKPYQGPFENRVTKTIEQRCFTDECEWRFVPKVSHLDLHQVIYDAADSVMPMFIKSRDDVDMAIEKINNQLQNYPDLILIKQKIKAEEEIRNKRIDRYEDGTDLIKCFE